jgi:hypothetical protein
MNVAATAAASCAVSQESNLWSSIVRASRTDHALHKPAERLAILTFAHVSSPRGFTTSLLAISPVAQMFRLQFARVTTAVGRLAYTDWVGFFLGARAASRALLRVIIRYHLAHR